MMRLGYRRILVCIDNSDHSALCADTAVALAGKFGSEVTGLHVYAARLHDIRFRQMESGLPARYHGDETLEKQRDIHESLIEKGLRLVGDSYLSVLEQKCRAANVAFEGKNVEGRNFEEIAREIESGRYDLAILGAQGLGAVEAGGVGSVCERVARRSRVDVWVVRPGGWPAAPDVSGRSILVALDGSRHAFGALNTAFDLAKKFSLPVRVVAAFDPHFHKIAFRGISRVISPEAAKVFRFQEQEKLHDELIDDGIAKIYKSYLDLAEQLARKRGVAVTTDILSGKACLVIREYARKHNPALLLLGRIGIHSGDGMDIGGVSERLLRETDAPTLLSSRTASHEIDRHQREQVEWTDEAKARLERVPTFVRNMAAITIVQHAVKKGHSVITSGIIDEVMESLFQGRARGAPTPEGLREIRSGTKPNLAGETQVPTLRLLFWETTAACNLSCVHCRRLDLTRKNDLTTDEASRFLDNLADYMRPILVLSGGEPLIRPDIFGITRHAVDLGFMVALATNGTLIDDGMADRIVESQIRRVAISIDGPDPQTHDLLRKQPGSLHAALDGFDRLKNRGMSLQINCTLTRHNVAKREDIYRLAVDRGADALHFFLLVPVGCGMQIEKTNQLTADEYEEALTWIYRRSREGKLQMKATCAPHYFRIMRQEARKSGAPPVVEAGAGMAQMMTKGCLAGTSICFVSHQGDVFPCGYLPLSAGNLRRESFHEIWEKSPILSALREPELLKGKCGACEFRNACLGCRARAYFKTGDFLDEEPFCSYEPVKIKSSFPRKRESMVSPGEKQTGFPLSRE